MNNRTNHAFLALTSIMTLASCAAVTPGGGNTLATGAAGGSTSVNANRDLERCTSSLGTLAVDDGRGQYGGETGVTTVEPLIRLAAQQSNCFVVTAIGNQRIEGRMERDMDKFRNSGEFRAGSNVEKGQRVVADYLLEPRIVINNQQTSNIGGAALGIGLGVLGVPGAGAIGGAMQTRETAVALSLFDYRSGVQISASQGSASANSFTTGLGGLGLFGSTIAGGALGGGYNTPEAQATVGAFLDAYNNMVRALKNYQAQDVKGGLGRGGTLKVN